VNLTDDHWDGMIAQWNHEKRLQAENPDGPHWQMCHCERCCPDPSVHGQLWDGDVDDCSQAEVACG
jgi:hypothetical protein